MEREPECTVRRRHRCRVAGKARAPRWSRGQGTRSRRRTRRRDRHIVVITSRGKRRRDADADATGTSRPCAWPSHRLVNKDKPVIWRVTLKSESFWFIRNIRMKQFDGKDSARRRQGCAWILVDRTSITGNEGRVTLGRQSKTVRLKPDANSMH